METSFIVISRIPDDAMTQIPEYNFYYREFKESSTLRIDFMIDTCDREKFCKSFFFCSRSTINTNIIFNNFVYKITTRDAFIRRKLV